MIESVAGFIIAAPMPWTARNAISIPPLVEAAGERGEGEDDKAGDEDPPPPEQVGELAAGEHQHGKGQEVAVHDPLELGHADVKVALDRRQRDVHDRVVEHDHEQPEGDGDESPPLAVLFVEEAGENLRAHS